MAGAAFESSARLSLPRKAPLDTFSERRKVGVTAGKIGVIVTRAGDGVEPFWLRRGLENSPSMAEWYYLVPVAVENQQRAFDALDFLKGVVLS